MCSPDDIIGSPYCVRRYVVDESFGGPQALAKARQELADRGVRLVLDYVPNHVAPDHPWTSEHPERFVRGGQNDLDADPASWISVGGQVLARGRDPYFPAWPDVVQLDAFSPALRNATAETLADISDQCDGIRCDMAMLLTNDVFSRTWGGRTGPRRRRSFGPRSSASCANAIPRRCLSPRLTGTSNGNCSSRVSISATTSGSTTGSWPPSPAPYEAIYGADIGYQSRLLRFLENHDEPRVAERMPPEAERAAAIAIATLPGATMWHEGQFEGRRVRPPVFLARRPDEPSDQSLASWYRSLVEAIGASGMREGEWRQLDVTGWPDNQSCANLLAWSWSGGGAGGASNRFVVVVNLSGRARSGPGGAALGRHRRSVVAVHRPPRKKRASIVTAPSCKARVCSYRSTRGRPTRWPCDNEVWLTLAKRHFSGGG